MSKWLANSAGGDQIEALFGRKRTSLFPPPGVDASETFFANLDRNSDGRLYVGVAAPGRPLKAILLRTYVALLGAAQRDLQRRGVQLAARLVSLIEEREHVTVPQGALDITLYRDDLQTVGPRPVVGPTSIPEDIDGKRVVIVDDVLYTGRTVRAALDELADFGRPRRIALAVLVDRGGRELPIHADVVGKKAAVPPGGRIDVLIEELDGRDAVIQVEPETGA